MQGNTPSDGGGRSFPGLGSGPMGPADGATAAPSTQPAAPTITAAPPGPLATVTAVAPVIGLGGDALVVHPEHHKKVIHVFTVEFARVETPFIIGLWIFFASLAKIGE